MAQAIKLGDGEGQDALVTGAASSQVDDSAASLRLDGLVYRGRRTEIYTAEGLTGPRVIIKRLCTNAQSQENIERLRHEFEILSSFSSPRVRGALGFAEVSGHISLILQDPGGQGLKDYLGVSPSLSLKIKLAEKWARALAEIHVIGVLHGDVTPHNILITPSDGAVYLIDFGLARHLSRAPSALAGEASVEGTLPYIAPELTGRTNLQIDERADLYSLGACLYELLTGILPVQGSTPLEILHAHLAHIPVPPHEHNPDLPQCLSHLVLKLLAKAPGERYRSALGVAHDLAAIGVMLEAQDHQALQTFVLSQRDFSLRLPILSRMYGREDQVQLLKSKWNGVLSGTSALVLVQGASGSGKTSLIKELATEVWRHNAYAANGKHEILTRDLPYYAITQASRQLIATVQADKPEIYEAWCRVVETTLIPAVPLLREMIPELATFADTDAQTLEVGPLEARSRLHQAFFRFFATFAPVGRPLLLFFDDLQWADSASLELLADLAKDAHGRWLLIGAYRDDEVDTKHVLTPFLREWALTHPGFCQIGIGAISYEATTEWCRDLLGHDSEQIPALAAILHQRSHGNPFFLRQFIQALYRDGRLSVSLTRECWEADISSIRILPMGDHVVSLLVSRLRSMSPSVQSVMACAAYVGTEFTAETLAQVLTVSEVEVIHGLQAALREELILRVDQESQSTRSESGMHPSQTYRFLHDGVIEASRALIDADQTLHLRLRIGRLLTESQHSQDSMPTAHWLLVVQGLEHCASALTLIRDQAELEGLAHLACAAGERAQAAAAWNTGLSLFRNGLLFLPLDATVRCRSLRRRLQAGEGSCAMLAGQAELARQIFEALLSDSSTDMETAEVQSLRCRLFISVQKYTEAVAVGIEGLRVLGAWSGSVNIGPARASLTAFYCQWRISHYTREQLLALPEVKDPRVLLIMRLVSDLFHPSQMTNSWLTVMLVCKQLELLLKHGHSSYSAFPLLFMVIVLSGTSAILGLKLWTKRTPQLLLDVYRELESKAGADVSKLLREFAYRAYAVVWSPGFRDEITGLLQLAPKFAEIGNVNLAAASILYGADLCWEVGRNAVKLKSQCDAWAEYASLTFDTTSLRTFNRVRQTITLLVDGDSSRIPDTIRAMSIKGMDRREDKAHINSMFANKGLVLTIFGHYEEAFRNFVHAIRTGFLVNSAGNYNALFTYFLMALATARSYGGRPWWGKPWRLLVMRVLRRLLRFYAEINPALSNHKSMFADALWLIMRHKDVPKAYRMMEEAMEIAQREHFDFDEALIAESLGTFLLEAGSPRLAAGPLVTARGTYERIGFFSKVRALDEVMLSLPINLQRLEADSLEAHGSGHTTGKLGSSVFDIPTLTRAAYALSREIKVDVLKNTMLHLLVENAGARHAALLWRVQAADAQRGPIQVVAYRRATGASSVEPLAPSDDLVSLRVLSFVERSQKALIIDDVRTESGWRNDPSLLARGARSVLCFPIMVGGVQNGSIYLENELLPQAFPSGRLETISVLAGQLAISLDNASLYDHLSQSLQAERQVRVQEQAAHQAYIAAEASRLKLQASIEAAEAVQKSLVNVACHAETYEIAYLYDPAENTGGDWLSTYYVESREWLFLCLGDVTGHGVQAALVTAAAAGAAASTVGRMGKMEHDLKSAVDAMMEAMNTAVSSVGSSTGKFMTMVVVGVDLQTGVARYVNAAHEPVIWLGQEMRSVLQGGDPLGLSLKSHFGKKDLLLTPNDILILYSDGLLQNPDSSGQCMKFSSMRRLGHMEHDPEALIKSLHVRVSSFVKSPSRDDTSCLVFRWVGAKALRKAS
jgi:predicted ATPase/serine phosphatase RsbU (regulator of sigma subunit)/tRNA A-37 threonylcarbamoyl transferase component Bud32